MFDFRSGALLADIWDADRRGIAMAYFSLAPFAVSGLNREERQLY